MERYDSIEQLLGDIEAVDVLNGAYFAFDARGTVLRLSVEYDRILLTETTDRNKDKLIEMLHQQLEEATKPAVKTYYEKLISEVSRATENS